MKSAKRQLPFVRVRVNPRGVTRRSGSSSLDIVTNWLLAKLPINSFWGVAGG
jgi:hypothetical protein